MVFLSMLVIIFGSQTTNPMPEFTDPVENLKWQECLRWAKAQTWMKTPESKMFWTIRPNIGVEEMVDRYGKPKFVRQDLAIYTFKNARISVYFDATCHAKLIGIGPLVWGTGMGRDLSEHWMDNLNLDVLKNYYPRSNKLKSNRQKR